MVHSGNLPSPRNHISMRYNCISKVRMFLSHTASNRANRASKINSLGLKTRNMTFGFHFDSRDYAEFLLAMFLEVATSAESHFLGVLSVSRCLRHRTARGRLGKCARGVHGKFE